MESDLGDRVQEARDAIEETGQIIGRVARESAKELFRRLMYLALNGGISADSTGSPPLDVIRHLTEQNEKDRVARDRMRQARDAAHGPGV